MSVRASFRPPRRPLLLFILLTLLASVLVLAFGWRLLSNLQQGQRQADARREEAADLAVKALEQALSATEAALRDRDAVRFLARTPDSIAVIIDGTQLEALPHGRLLYYPVASPDAAGEVPPELFARWSKCVLLAEQGQIGPLRTDALELRELLLDGRWRITRPVFERHLQAASAWAGAGEPPAQYRLALSEAVEHLWRLRREQERKAPRRGTIRAGGLRLTVLSHSAGGRTHALIAGSTYVEHQWKASIATIERDHAVHVALVDANEVSTASRASRRSAANTGLPWTITAQSTK